LASSIAVVAIAASAADALSCFFLDQARDPRSQQEEEISRSELYGTSDNLRLADSLSLGDNPQWRCVS
jgi:hypothetical protein